MGEIRELNRDYIPPFNRNVFFKALNIINIYNLNAIFRQPRSILTMNTNKKPDPMLFEFDKKNQIKPLFFQKKKT